MAKDNLLKEAIADAKAVRETALANAKLALTEAFTPKLQSMLSSKLRNEMEGDFSQGDLNTPGVGNEIDPTIKKEAKDVTANADSDPEAEKAGAVAGGGGQGLETKGVQALKLTEVGEEEEEVPGEEEEVPGDEFGGEVAPEVGAEVPPGAEGEVAPEVGAEVSPEGEFGAPEEEEDDVELEAIIRELEAEEEEPVAEPFAGGEVPSGVPGEVPGEEEEIPAEEAKDVTAIASQDPEKGLAGDVGPESGSETAVETTPTTGQETVGDEPELDLESLVKEIEGEMGDEEEEEEKEKFNFENLKKENVQLRKALKEHRDVVVYLRDRLNEINLLNAKLLYSNKLFRSNSLNESQKLRVVEAIDRANTIREVKLVYATLAENFKTKGKPLTESKKTVTSASKVVKSTKPATVITEGVTLSERFKFLAGGKKVSRIL